MEQLTQAISELTRAIKEGHCQHQVLNALNRIDNKLDKIMSKITDWAAQEQADLTAISATLDSVVTGIAALDTLITNFQNSPGTLPAADQKALDDVQAASTALRAKAAAISVAPPTPPAPPAPPTP